MIIGVYISIKFRSMKITFGKVERAWRVVLPDFRASEISLGSIPVSAKTVYDKSGIILKFWSI